LINSELGERESGTADLQAAVVAFRAVRQERTRERMPLKWAYSQHGLGGVAGNCSGYTRAGRSCRWFRFSRSAAYIPACCSFALAEEGTDTRPIQDFLGHKDIKSTVIYTETSQRRLAAVRVR
jgi:hypothetical protein